MQRDWDAVPADHLDRRVQRDLTAADAVASSDQQADEVARRDGAEELTRFRCLAKHREALTVELFGDLARVILQRLRARLQLALHRFEARPVLVRRAPSL